MSNPNDTGFPLAAPTADGARNGRPLTLADRVRSLRLPDRTLTPPPRTARLPWLLCLVFAGTSGYLGYRSYSEPPARPLAPTTTASTATTAGGPTEPAPALQALESGGFIIPVRRIQISPKVGGQVTRLFFEEGEFVKEGEPLALIDRTKYEYAYLRLSAAAEQARAEYEKAKSGNRPEEKLQADAAWRESVANREQIRDELDRLRRAHLATATEELIRSQSRLRQAEYKVKQLDQLNRMMRIGSRQEDIDKAYYAWQNTLAQRDDARYDFDSTIVLAPESGVILKKYAEEGNMVRPEAYSNGLSASLYDMANLKEVEVDVDVSERDIEFVFKGQRCEVRAEAFPSRSYAGKVSRLMPEAVRSKGSIPVRVRVRVPEGDTLLRPEMRARVRFLPREKIAAAPAKKK